MTLIPWKPYFWDIDKFFEDEWTDWPDLKLSRSLNQKVPKMDIYEEGGNLVAEIELPGIDVKDINVEVEDNYLKVEAKKEEKKEEKEKGYYRKELSKGYLRRFVPLPFNVVKDKAEAEYKDGILKVIIPKEKAKKEEKKGIKVKIK